MTPPARPPQPHVPRTAFILANTTPARPPLVPEITLQLATRITPIWQATEEYLAQVNLAPPYWAFAWPGSQAIARHIIDNPSFVTGRRVLDFAAGSGLAAIACALSGAASVEAVDIDPLSADATNLNAAANAAAVTTTSGDIVGQPSRWDLILCGDVCYEAPMTAHILPWLQQLAHSAEVWIADPGRAYLPEPSVIEFATYEVPTSLELECQTARHTRLMRLLPGNPP